MYLKKIKNNNKGLDMAFIGTNYILILVIIACIFIDLFSITYGKMTMINITKECELYALSKHYDSSTMWKNQQIMLDTWTKENIVTEFYNQWSYSVGHGNGFMQNVYLNKTDITCIVDQNEQSIILTAPNIVFTPTKVFKNTTTLIPFFGQSLDLQTDTVREDLIGEKQVHVVSRNGSDTIKSGVATKIAFIPQ